MPNQVHTVKELQITAQFNQFNINLVDVARDSSVNSRRLGYFGNFT